MREELETKIEDFVTQVGKSASNMSHQIAEIGGGNMSNGISLIYHVVPNSEKLKYMGVGGMIVAGGFGVFYGFKVLKEAIEKDKSIRNEINTNIDNAVINSRKNENKEEN